MRSLRALLAVWVTGLTLGLWPLALGQDRYVADLTSPDRQTRRRAAAALGNRRLQAAVPALLATLKDDLDAGVRAAAAVALGKIKAPEAIPPLVNALREPDADVRRAALRALLMFYIEDDIEFVFARRRGLSRFNPFLETDEPTTVLAGTVVAPEVLQALADTMRDDANPDNRRAAVRALGVLRADAMASAMVEALGDPALRMDIFRVFVKLGRPEYGIHILPYLNDRDADVRRQAIDAVGRLRTREAVTPLMARYRAARPGDDQQTVILAALARIGDPASETIFSENLNQRSPERRRFAAEGLGRCGATAYVDRLLNDRLTEKNESVRLAQAFALYRLGRTDFLQEVVGQLDSLRHGAQAESYLYSLTRSADLHPYLRSAGVRGIERMMRAMERIGTRDDLPVLQPLLRSSDRRIANAANRAIRQIEARAGVARD
ncbi:MAG: HEAT repeat domain-containing protein [Chloracidobacterium sp.]|nr:HEAT repeat domain-containing protein [Chloracidobacterium sp.]MDW8216803.1 HEAT repeat domain-containing protein [Acidobacteriota bacterium]